MSMKGKTLAAIAALCMAMVCAFADAKSDALIAAAKNNNTEEVAQLIADGAEVNARDIDGFTALMWAAGNNAADAARLLIAAGADVNAKNDDGKTALMIAEAHDAADVVRVFKAAGAQ